MCKKWIVLPLLMTLLLVGCNLSEDLTDCGILRLNLSFTYNSEQTDNLETEVRDVNFYIFDDATSLLVRKVEATASDIARGYTEVRDLPAGKYTIVAWGGSSEDLLSSGFMEIEMDDAADHSYRDLWDDDETLIDDFYMMIDHDLLPDPEVLGDLAPKTDGFDDLFYDVAAGVEVKQITNQTVDFDFIRNSNLLKVTITGLEHLATYNPSRAAAGEQPLQVYVVGKNGRYMWDNTIDPYARLVRYEPPCTSLDANTMVVDIKTLHLDLARHTAADPIQLYVVNPATGNDMIYPLDVMDAIGQVKDDAGNYLYQTQEAIDREYEYPIDISILADLSVHVFINDWEIINLTPNM